MSLSTGIARVVEERPFQGRVPKQYALAFRPSGATRAEAQHLFHRDAALKAPLFHGTKSCAALTAQAAAR